MSEPNFGEFPRLTIMPRYSLLEPELLSSDGPLSLFRTVSILISGTTFMTLGDSLIDGFVKRIQTQGSSVNTTVICSLNQAGGNFVSFTIGGNGKCELLWDNESSFWRIFDQKNLTKNL